MFLKSESPIGKKPAPWRPRIQFENFPWDVPVLTANNIYNFISSIWSKEINRFYWVNIILNYLSILPIWIERSIRGGDNCSSRSNSRIWHSPHSQFTITHYSSHCPLYLPISWGLIFLLDSVFTDNCTFPILGLKNLALSNLLKLDNLKK